MKITSFRVTNFRNAVDTGKIEVEPSVTCLVGKNEAGKSGLLEALFLFNPAYESPFDVHDQYPRWRMAQDRRDGNLEEHTPITVTLRLDEDDHSAIRNVVGKGVWNPTEVTFGRRYDGGLVWSPPHFPEAKAVASLTARFADSVKSKVSGTTTLDDLRRRLAEPDPDNAHQPSPAELDAARGTIADLQLDKQSFLDACKDILRPRLPTFFRFTQYSTLPGRVNFQDIIAEQEDGPPRDDLQTVRALLALAGAEVGQLANDEYELRKAELEAVQVNLTNQVFDYWHQNPDLEVILDADREPDGSRFLDIRLRDRRTGYSNNFSQRSSGFQWFFSFLAAFSEFKTERPPVILLDEPALNLHGRAQGDFLKFINDRLGVESPVIYTTHSSFMVKPGGIDQVRIVEDKGPPLGAVVSTGLTAKDPDSLFPLQAALGYDIAQNLFVGPHNLVVEGISDYIYFTSMSDACVEAGREGLDERWRILPAGSAANVPTFVSLVGPRLDVTVVVDSDAKGVQRIKNMVDDIIAASRVVFVDAAVESSHAETEDLFEQTDYIDLYNETFEDKSVDFEALPPGDRITKRIAKMAGNFNHGRVAETLIRRRREMSFSEGTLDRFSRLFGLINLTIDESK